MKVATVLKVLSLAFTLLLIAVVAPIGFILLKDANDFKPELEQLAYDQGVTLNISGDLSWRIYPDIELEVNQASIASQQGNLDLQADLGVARLQVELRPLFSGELKIRGVEVSDTEVKLTELAEETVEDTESNISDSSDEGREALTNASAQQVLFQQLKLEYLSLDGEVVQININELLFEQFNLEGEPFPARLSLTYQGSEQVETIVSTSASLSIDPKQQIYRLETEQLTVERNGESPIDVSARIDATANLASNQWNLLLSEASLEDLKAKANASGRIDPLSATGQLELSGGAQLINRSADNVTLESLSLGAGFDYSPEQLLVKDIVVKLNKSTLTASLEYYLQDQQENELRLTLDQVNLDELIDKDAKSKDSENLEQGENPLLFLEDMPVTRVSLDVGALQSNDHILTNIELNATIKDAEAAIQLANATLAEGTIKGDLVARSKKQPQLVVSNFSAADINLAPLSLNENGNPLLQGMATVNFSGQLESLSGKPSSGASVLKGLDGQGEMDITKLVLADNNIEQSICISAQQLGATSALTEQWTAGTEFDQMKSPYQISNGVLILDDIGTGFGNIKLNGSGQLDLDTLDFGAKLSLYVNGNRTSEKGCSINQYIRNTSLPLNCDGNLSEGGDTSCGLDSSVVAELLKGQIKNQLGRQLNKLLGIEASNNEANGSNTEDQNQDSSDDVKDAVKGLLEGLFR